MKKYLRLRTSLTGCLMHMSRLSGYPLGTNNLGPLSKKGTWKRRLSCNLRTWIHRSSRDLATDALLPYLESTISSRGGFLLAQSVIELPLHMAASINVPGVVHPPQLNQSIVCAW